MPHPRPALAVTLAAALMSLVLALAPWSAHAATSAPGGGAPSGAGGPGDPLWGPGNCLPWLADSAPGSCTDRGKVNYFSRIGQWPLDGYLPQDSAGLPTGFAGWMDRHFDRSQAWDWWSWTVGKSYKRGLAYRNSHAIGVMSDGTPDPNEKQWVLRSGPEANATNLYINHGCQLTGAPSCANFAGDLTDPAFRAWRIKQFKDMYMAGPTPGYTGPRMFAGIWVDDLNIQLAFTKGENVDSNSRMGSYVTPYSRYLGRYLSVADWRAGVAAFTTDLRAALPWPIDILANVHWDPNTPGGGFNDTAVRQIIVPLSYVELEGYSHDSNIQGGQLPATYTFSNFWEWVRGIHSLGRSVIWDDFATAAVPREYGLANYFLLSNGNDGIGLAGQIPTTWWPGYDLDLGQSQGDAWFWPPADAWRRDFANGMVLLREPPAAGGSPNSVTFDLPTPMVRTDGRIASTGVTMGSREGLVLLKSSTAKRYADFAAIDAGGVRVARGTRRGLAGPTSRPWNPALGSRTTGIANVDGSGPDEIVGVTTGGTVSVSSLVDSPTAPAVTSSTPVGLGKGGYGMFFADVNGDGRADVVTVESGKITWSLAAADRTFGAASSFVVPGTFGATGKLAVADADGDGKSDVIWWSTTGIPVVARSTGTTFLSPLAWTSSTTPAFYGSVANVVGDINADGVADYIAVGDTDVRVLLGKAARNVGDVPVAGGAASTGWSDCKSITLADVTGDGVRELVCWRASGVVYRSTTGTGMGVNLGAPGPDIGLGEAFSGTQANLVGQLDNS